MMTMWKKCLLTLFGLIFGLTLSGQRFGIVDSEYILKQMPDYSSAKQQLDQLSRTWEGEVQSLMQEAEALRKSYEAEKVLLTEKMREKRLAAIKAKEEEAQNKQQTYFGPKGKLYTKRLELIKPIQDKVFNAIREVAQKRNLDAVFDKGSDLIALYVSERVEISDQVIQKLKNQ